MDGIKYVADLCHVEEQRKLHEEAKEKLFIMERQMAEMTLDYEVGVYANRLDRIFIY